MVSRNLYKVFIVITLILFLVTILSLLPVFLPVPIPKFIWVNGPLILLVAIVCAVITLILKKLSNPKVAA